MKLLITRPVVIAGDGGARAFAPGLTVEVDAATAETILAQRAGIAAGPAQAQPIQTKPASPAHANAAASNPRRRKPADAEA